MKTFIRLYKRLSIFFIAAALLLWAVPGEAQYFGRNKVQYDSLKFKIMKTEHFDIYFYPEEKDAAEIAGRMAERWYARFARILNHQLSGRQPLILYSSSSHFQQSTVISGVLGETTGGVTESVKRRIVLPFGASLAETDHVIGHELVHAFQFDIASRAERDSTTTRSTAMALPLWLIEGLAEYLSIGVVDPHTAMWMREATRLEDLPTLKKMRNNYKYFPYRFGQSLWAYIAGKWGDEVVETLLKAAGRTGSYEEAIKSVLNIEPEQLSEDWHKAMNDVYTPLLEQTELASRRAQILFKGSKQNPLNIAPVISPDGQNMIFLSTKDMLSIDMFIADAATGQIRKKLVETIANPHFESIQFIKSAGCWDRESKRFIFPGIANGRPILVIADAESGKYIQKIGFPDLDEILSPSWGPDGSSIVFSAMKGGQSDLYIYDLSKESLNNLTADPYGDLNPAWSPDGSAIAFATERFSVDLKLLDSGKYDLALYIPETGEITALPGFPGAKNINPQWSSDSRFLYFVSDKNGISNIFKLDVAGGNIVQVTNLYSGVTGITSLSPAMSMAQDAKKLAFTVYEEGNYSIYTLDEGQTTESLAIGEFGDVRPDVLPPRQKPSGSVLDLLRNPLFGLQEAGFPVENYKPKLKLDNVVQSSIGIGVDRFGTYAGGGLSMYFSDMMGYHSVVGMMSGNTRLMDSSFLVGYQNTKSRLNWGAVVQRYPYVYGFYSQFLDFEGGIPTIVEDEVLFRQINYEVSGFASYPFSRSQRFELGGGYRLTDFNNVIYRNYYDASDGFNLGRDRISLPSAPSLHFGFVNAALVYDTSAFGITAPIIGQSYRVQVSPYFGTINFTSVIADFRKYLSPVKPFTLALRIMHYGRYGPGAGDSRFYPMFLGYESLVRGYNYRSFSQDEALSDPDSLDRLFGNKIAVANVELRFPLFGVLGIGKGYYGILPLDVNAFFDTGVAWDTENRLWFQGGARKPVASAGIGLRFNLFGYMVLGAHYVKPFSRDRNPYIQITLMPGF